MLYKTLLLQCSVFVFVVKQGLSCNDDDWIQNGGNCYRIFTERVNKSIAETTCLEHRSALVSISTVEEHTFIVTQLSQANTTAENFWVGLHKIENQLLWNNRASAGSIPWVDVPSSSSEFSDCFIFNGAKVLRSDCSAAACFICEQWNLTDSRPTTCPEDTHKDVLSEKCFWYTHTPLSKAGSEVICSLNHGQLLTLRGGVLFPFNIAMILMVSPPPRPASQSSHPIVLWTSLVFRNGSFRFEDDTEFYHEDFVLRRDVGECVALFVEKGNGYELHQKPCLDEALGFCELNMDFLSVDVSSIFGTRNNDVGSTSLVPSCPVGNNWQEDEETGFCYWETSYETTRLSWKDARKYCQSYGGDLASFHSAKEEQIGLGFQFGSVEHSYWIGLYYDADRGHYVWADGTPMDYENWDIGSPNNADRRMRCGYMSSIKKKWVLTYCGMLSWFICKASKQLNGPPPAPPTAEPLTTCSEDGSEFFFDGYCYQKISRIYGWHRAQQFCENQRANLVSLHSEDELDFIIRLLAKSTPAQGNRVWIGLNSLGLGGAFKWTDGSPVVYTNWDIDEPNNFQNQEKCANMYTQHGMWNDENCNSVMNFICKRRNGTYIEPSTTTPAPVTGYCKKDWYMFGDRCFLPVGLRKTQRKNWTEASMHCLNLGGYLASVRDDKDQAFMYYLIQSLKMDTWIGLHDSIHSGIFYWTDNSPLFFTKWGPGQPSSYGFQEDCGAIRYGDTNGGTWEDTGCHRELPYICQTHRDPSLTSPGDVRGTRCPHPTDYMKQGLSCYKVFTDPLTWDEAQAVCRKDGAYLVSIFDHEKEAVVNYLVATSLGENKTFWIGLRHNEKDPMQWVNQFPLSFTKWGRNEPKMILGQNGTCYYSTLSGFWQGAPCSEKKAFLCHQSADKLPIPVEKIIGNCSKADPSSQWTEIGGFCMTFGLRFTVEWYTANFHCYSKGAHLASFHSMKMLSSLQYYLGGATREPIFIGLTKNSEGGFAWADKSPVDFVNWDQGEPQEIDFHCVDMRLDTMKWRVADCDSRKYFVCAKENENILNNTDSTSKFSDNHTSTKDGDSRGLHPSIVVAIVFCLIILAAAAVVAFLRFRSRKNDANRYRVHVPEPVTGFENAIYYDETNNVDIHDRNVLFANN